MNLPPAPIAVNLRSLNMYDIDDLERHSIYILQLTVRDIEAVSKVCILRSTPKSPKGDLLKDNDL